MLCCGEQNSPQNESIVSFSGCSDIVISVPKSILHVATENRIEIPHYCGGNSRCGTCIVEVFNGAENLSKATGTEQIVLGIDKFQKGHRLACQAKIIGNVSVKIPNWF